MIMDTDFKLAFVLSIKNRKLDYDFALCKSGYSRKLSIGNNLDFCVNSILQEADENMMSVTVSESFHHQYSQVVLMISLMRNEFKRH